MTQGLEIEQIATQSIIDDCLFFNRKIGQTFLTENSSYEIFGTKERYVSGLPYPILNGIMLPDANETAISSNFIQTQLEYFNSLKLPHVWWLISEKQKEAISPDLLKAGYSFAGVYTGMVTDLSGRLPPISEVEIKTQEVNNAHEYDIWLNTFAEIFNTDLASTQAYKKLMKEYGKGKPFRHIWASREGKPVGVLSYFKGSIYCNASGGGVLKEERKFGVGRALGHHFAKIAKEEGHSHATTALMGGALAKGLCKRFGFYKVSEIYPYIYGIDPKNFEPT